MTTAAPAAPQQQPHAEGLHVREFRVREVDADRREVVGLAVPWNEEARIWDWDGDYMESFAPGSITAREGEPKAFWLHGGIVGAASSYRDIDAGWEVALRISATSLGNDVLALVRDGAVDRFSVGFVPIEHTETVDEDGVRHVVRTRVEVREVSLTPWPAYDGAKVSAVRHQPTARSTTPTDEGAPPVTTTAPESPALTDVEVRSMLEETERRLSVQITDATAGGSPAPVEQRSAGQLLLDAIAGDESALEALNLGHQAAFDTRSVVGPTARVISRDDGTPPVTTAAAGGQLKAAWVGDVTRLVDEAAGVRGLFAEGVLPSTGKFIEYGILGTDASAVGEQAAEGDDLTYGEVTVDSDTAPIVTYGGYSQLTRQAIERSTAPLLDLNLRGQAIAAGRYINGAFRTAYDALRTAQATAGNTVPVPSTGDVWADWLDAIVDAAVKYEDLGLSLDGLIVDTAQFKAFNRFEGSDGRPLFTYTGTGTNVVGSLDVTTLRGDIANLPVFLNAKQATAGQAFFNRQALRTYRSPLVRLQDDNIINLTRAFSIYGYAAFAPEIPDAVVPVNRTV